MSRASWGFAILLLAGCTAAPVVPTEVKVPVPVACIDRPVDKIELMTDDELKALNDYQLPLALWLDRRLRQIYEARLEATLDGCWFPAPARGGT